MRLEEDHRRRGRKRLRAESDAARDPPPPEQVRVFVQVLCVRGDGAVLLRAHDGGELAGLSTGLLGPLGAGETLEDAARRLAAPLRLDALRRGGVFTFVDEGVGGFAVEHEFTARVEHAAPPLPAAARWVARDELDFAAMPADDAHWYERVLDGELLHGSFVFGAPNALRGKHVRALSALLDDDDGASQPYTRIKLPGGHPILDEVRYAD